MKLRARVVYLTVPGGGGGGAHGLPSHPAEALEASVMTASLMERRSTLQLQIQILQRS
jgi:hypothetical protein